jgi:hypothetical protein
MVAGMPCRFSRRIHGQGQGPIAKIPRTRRRRATHCGRNVIGTSLYLREPASVGQMLRAAAAQGDADLDDAAVIRAAARAAGLAPDS